jgi:glycosyltransferase involved in cell wall biosynthesis
VEIAGAKRQEDLPVYYDRSHFLLQASRYESQGVVFNEAMASGTVVCSTRVGLADDIGDSACIVADVGDTAGLVREILQVIVDETRYSELRKSGYAWARQHDAHWTASQYERIYARLTRAGDRASAVD